MSQSDSIIDLQLLSAVEKLNLIGLLWDSLSDSPGSLPMPEWHEHELDLRIAAADANPSAAVPWDDVKNRLRERS